VARQKLGQHFLIKGAILNRIAAAACPDPVPLVIEIGPGRGALTERLLGRAERVVAIEIDPTLVEHLRQKFAGNPRLEIVQADVLATDLGAWGPAPIAGNLPYYITSPILARSLRVHPPRAVFLMQKEVAERLVASPGRREYGLLTASVALEASAQLLFEVKPGAFVPPPKVDSAVVLLEPRPLPEGLTDSSGFRRFLELCFAHKRKTLRNNLASVYGGDALAGQPEAGLRAEQLSVTDLFAVYQRIKSAKVG
jgi:16S rRNA (adenine1518-N6/adenine1519-N6)-dimethyltransferase